MNGLEIRFLKKAVAVRRGCSRKRYECDRIYKHIMRGALSRREAMAAVALIDELRRMTIDACAECGVPYCGLCDQCFVARVSNKITEMESGLCDE